MYCFGIFRKVERLRKRWRGRWLLLMAGKHVVQVRRAPLLLGTSVNVDVGRTGRIVFEGKAELRSLVTLNASSGLISIGHDTFINGYTSINARERVLIGSRCLIGEGVRIYDHDHLREGGQVSPSDFKAAAVTIEDEVWIGSNVVILRGSAIGKGAVIGAGSLIKGRIAAGAVIYRRRDE